MSEHAAQLSEATDEADALRQLLKSRGWELLNNWLQQEIDNRREEYETTGMHPSVMNDVYINGYRRAQLAMLRTIQDMPKMLIASNEEAIEQIREGKSDVDEE